MCKNRSKTCASGVIGKLRKAGLNFESELYQARPAVGGLAGKTFVLTGTLPTLP